MAKIKLTKNELKHQKDALKRFHRFLPMLLLKKRQLQIEIMRIRRDLGETRSELHHHLQSIEPWIAVLVGEAEPCDLIQPSNEIIGRDNVAGVELPRLEEVQFAVVRYDLFLQPLWLDAALEALKKVASLDLQMEILARQESLISQELEVTSQRVNLFERVRIPETVRNIQKLRTFLGDQDTAAVVRGKMSKRKRSLAPQDS
ncbi:MAG: V-type ATP synthase subunit D [Acidimicrobiia bacterium]|nr:V-type ATP synthase subunit D [Acidimicrobiia bacterium]